MVTPALWHPDDSDMKKATADYRSVFLSYYAHDHVKVEFCRPAKDVWSNVGPIQHYHDEHGCLTELGIAEIRAKPKRKNSSTWSSAHLKLKSSLIKFFTEKCVNVNFLSKLHV